ncbi:MAG: CoA transferase [Oceanospirillaceae bacterium]|nr:CoA transferase [Oceanospirillaceae bacterium]MCP5349670.1 CoA transferase [Oceanospirillaceae bacterium]
MHSPLQGLKVLDLSTLLPGPYATLMLADLGADVLRIEALNRPDMVRALPPKDASGESAAHSYLNRGKKSLALDLKQPEGADLLRSLVQHYDILVEQFRPGVMAKLGLDYDALGAINPRLIYCAITGYGQSGPNRDRAGHDINYLALAGVSDYSRRAGQPPVPQGIQVADVAGGSHHAVMGILAAVIERQRSGLGQFIDISMTDCAFAMNAMFAAGYLGGGVAPAAENNVLNGGGFYDYYTTADGRYLSIGSLEPPFLMALCEITGLTALAGKALSPLGQDAAEFKTALRNVIASRDFADWQDVFANADCCVEPVLSFAEACASEHIKSRGMVLNIQSPNGPVQQLANPLSRGSVASHSGAALGADTQQVLNELGFDEITIDALRQRKVVR